MIGSVGTAGLYKPSIMCSLVSNLTCIFYPIDARCYHFVSLAYCISNSKCRAKPASIKSLDFVKFVIRLLKPLSLRYFQNRNTLCVGCFLD